MLDQVFYMYIEHVFVLKICIFYSINFITFWIQNLLCLTLLLVVPSTIWNSNLESNFFSRLGYNKICWNGCSGLPSTTREKGNADCTIWLKGQRRSIIPDCRKCIFSQFSFNFHHRKSSWNLTISNTLFRYHFI